jgi:Activator of Hsp90 ATPase homolog 1-like protein
VNGSPSNVAFDLVSRSRDAASSRYRAHADSYSAGFSDEFRDKVAAERRSKVTFDIEPAGQIVKLTVVHDDFEPGSIVLENVSQGWPAILANLKTLLETGDTLPDGQDTARQDEKSLQP